MIVGVNLVKVWCYFDFFIFGIFSVVDFWLLKISKGNLILLDIVLIFNLWLIVVVISVFMLGFLFYFFYYIWIGKVLWVVS